jgi:CheY-like chemotaxis protein
MPDQPKTQILVVEDDVVLASIVKLQLQRADYAVTVAMNGRDAWEQAQRQQFDLLLTDEQMPVMSGHELCRLLRDDIRYRDMPIVFVTAKRFEMMRLLTDDLRISALISKPFSPRQLISTIDAVLAARTTAPAEIG